MSEQWMETAHDGAASIYQKFLREVLEKHILVKDRGGRPPAEKTQKKIDKGTHIDPRALRLMTISGKGGYTEDPERRKIYDRFRNITLLDHLLSVTRGALVFAAMDWASRNPDIERTALEKRLTAVAAIAFMHDADKDLRLARNADLTIADMEERMNRYGIPEFLESAGVSLTADQLRYLIEKVEATQGHRHPPETLPPREYETFSRTVRLADQLDGAWTSLDPETGGINGVLNRLKEDQGCLRSDFLRQWKEVRLFDPLHPFLLDELQRYLSRYSIHLAKIPPLIEVHHDGHLFMLLPESHYDEIVDRGLKALAGGLPFNMYLNVSTPGIPSLYNGHPSHSEVQYFISQLDHKLLKDLFKIKQSLKPSVAGELDDLLSDVGLQPRWPEKVGGQLLPVYATFANFEPEEMEWLLRAAHLVLLLNLKAVAKAKDKLPQSNERESELISVVGATPPEWITSISVDLSRRTVTALWATAKAWEDEELLDTLWDGEDALLKLWLEGTENRPGLNRYITGDGAEVINGVVLRYRQMLDGSCVSVSEETAAGRCIFTDEPVPLDKKISQAVGLYGVKVSAFSGRDGRPESVTSENAHTNVGPSSLAEHKLHAKTHEMQGGRDNGVPTLISSPVTAGLFGGLAMTDDKALGVMSIYDISRREIKKGRVLHGIEMYQGRYRMARLERVPEKLVDQVDMLRLMMTGCLRIGRPIHLFKGLPVQRKEFFYFDAMPRVLGELIGGNALCLEQIPHAVDQLRIAHDLLDANGLGHDVLKQYAMPRTRFGASCLAWCHLKDEEENRPALRAEMKRTLLQYLEGEKAMNEQDGALVRLGRTAAGIQKNPGGAASTSDELLVFNLCLDAVSAARKANQTDSLSMIYGVAGELETNLVRRDKAAARANRDGKSLMEGCEAVARLFVEEVWSGVMQGRFPSQKSRRVLSSIYRVSFLKTHKLITAKKKTDENREEN